jgi:hypothetical protein
MIIRADVPHALAERNMIGSIPLGQKIETEKKGSFGVTSSGGVPRSD